jgi:hypothetical protein
MAVLRLAAMRFVCRSTLVLATAALVGSCGGPPQVASDWFARLPPSQLDVLVLHITQDDDLLQGTACWVSGGVNQIAFKNVPVTGLYPVVNVSVPDFDGFTFFGEFQGDGTLAGQVRFTGTPNNRMAMSQGVPSEAAGCR